MRVSVLWLVSLVSAWCLLAPLTVVQAAAGSAGAESRGTATRTQADLDQQAQLQSTIHLDGESLVSQSPDYLSAVLPPLGGSAEPKLVTPADRFLAGPNFQPTAWSPLVGTQCKAFGAMGTCVSVAGCTGGRALTGVCRDVATPWCCVSAIKRGGYLGRVLAAITETAAVRLSPARQKASWARFKALHQKAYSSADVEAQRFAAFCKNRESIVRKNDRLGLQTAVFSSTSKFADVPSDTFRAKYLRLTAPILARRSSAAFLEQEQPSPVADALQTAFLEAGFIAPEYVHSTEHETVQLVRDTAVLPPWEEDAQVAQFLEADEAAFTAESESTDASEGQEMTEQESTADEVELVEESAAASAKGQPSTNPSPSAAPAGLRGPESSVRTAGTAAAAGIGPIAPPCTFDGQAGMCIAKSACQGTTHPGLCKGTPICCIKSIVTPNTIAPNNRVVGGVLTIDYRSLLTPIKDQVHCGDCWAQAAVAVYETAGVRAQKWDNKKQFSTQRLLDCVSSSSCAGGAPGSGLEFLKSNHAATLASYPHRGVKETCRNGTASQGFDGPLLEEWGYLFNRYPHDAEFSVTEESVLDALQKYGPMVVAVDASNWQNYAGGIFPAADCAGPVNHAVQLVGYGSETITNGGLKVEQKFWLLRNSWKDDWGEQGFIRVPAFTTGGACRINAWPAIGAF